MKSKYHLIGLLLGVFLFIFGSAAICAAPHPDKPIVVKLEDAKMAPVTFSHTNHIDKDKIACVTCHHKDPQAPKACTTCHGKEAKDKTPGAKDAFHNKCQGCHKSAANAGKAPTKCIECHKK